MSALTERPTQKPLLFPEQGIVLADATIEALRATVINLGKYLKMKDTPFFDQAIADELNRRQKEYIKILLQLRKQGVPVNIKVELLQGKDEKLNPYSQNPINVILPPKEAFGKAVIAKTRISELGNGTVAERLGLLGEKSIIEEGPLSYIKRTCSELYALRQDIKLEEANGRRKSAKTQKLKSLEYTIIRSRLLETEAQGETPEGAIIDVQTDPRTRDSRNPNINVNVSLAINHIIRTFYYPILGGMIACDPKAGVLLERIAAKKSASMK